MSDRPPMLKAGGTIGKLTILEMPHGKPAVCECSCGRVVFRSVAGLNSARLKAQEPQCKVCCRKSRKRKNPGGGGGPVRAFDPMPWGE